MYGCKSTDKNTLWHGCAKQKFVVWVVVDFFVTVYISVFHFAVCDADLILMHD